MKKQTEPSSLTTNRQEELSSGPPSGDCWTLMGFSSGIGARIGMTTFIIKDIGYDFEE